MDTSMPKFRQSPAVVFLEGLEVRRLLSAPPVPRGGVVTMSFTNGPSDANAIAVQPDGKFVVAGEATTYGNFGQSIRGVVARFNPDGALDGSFGTGGKVMVPGGPSDTVSAVAIQDDGKIVIAGDNSAYIGGNDFARPLLVRLNRDGTLDAAFNATAAAAFSHLSESVWGLKGLVLQRDGKFVVTGYDFAPDHPNRVTVFRVNADGSIDQTFGNAGENVPGGPFNIPEALALEPDGKILVGAVAVLGSGRPAGFGVARLNADGSADLSFGSGGIAVLSLNTGDGILQALTTTPDGRIVAVGDVQLSNSYSDDAVARLTSDGSPDRTFGNNGRETFDIHLYDDLKAVAANVDGSIVAAGISADATGFECMTVVRLRPAGSFDPSFGSGGMVVTHIGRFYSGANSLALLPDGRAVAAGVYSAGPDPRRGNTITNDQFAIGLFTADGRNDTSFGVPYDINHDGSVDFGDLLALSQHFGKTGTFAEGDLNGDGQVAMDDLLLLAKNFGNASATPAGGNTFA